MPEAQHEHSASSEGANNLLAESPTLPTLSAEGGGNRTNCDQ